MIPMFRPPQLDKEVAMSLIGDAIDRGYIGEGPNCKRFEELLAEYLKVQQPLFTNSGTSALRLAFHLAGARPGREVICTPMTCLATATAILETGADVVWADVGPDGNISPDSVAAMVTSKTVAVAAVDWGGNLCDYDRLRELTSGISIVEDAAHAFGVHGGSRGDFICYSLQAIKHVTTADGGVLVCPGAALTERARLLRWFGLDRSRGASMRCMQNVPEAGFKMQGNDILASIGIASIRGAADRFLTHRAHAATYRNAFAEHTRTVKLHDIDLHRSAWWFFPVLVSDPLRFTRFMASRGVEVAQVHARLDTQACFDGVRSLAMPGLEAFSAHQVNLPCGSHIDEEQRERVIKAVGEWSTLREASW